MTDASEVLDEGRAAVATGPLSVPRSRKRGASADQVVLRRSAIERAFVVMRMSCIAACCTITGFSCSSSEDVAIDRFDASAGMGGTASTGMGGSTSDAAMRGCVVQIDRSCARRTDNTLWCWGDNTHGQLGNGTTTGAECDMFSKCWEPLPVQVTALGTSVIDVSVGGGHVCARKADGTLWCWGAIDLGQLGDATTSGEPCGVQSSPYPWGTRGSCILLPVQVAALGADVAEVSAGGTHTCALKTDGTLWCWGDNVSGQLGLGTTDSDGGCCMGTPSQVVALSSDVAQVSAGSVHTCARKTDGTLWCWGENDYGQLGIGTLTRREPSPVQVVALGADVAEVSAGGAHTCARKRDGTLWCWGENDYGQLGDGTTSGEACLTDVCRPSPVQVSALGNGVAQVSAALFHTCARKIDGTLWCWGRNTFGELGDGTVGGQSCSVSLGICRPSPVQVADLADGVVEVAAGTGVTCALASDEKAYCWGYDGDGGLGSDAGVAQACHTTRTCKPSPVSVSVPCQ